MAKPAPAQSVRLVLESPPLRLATPEDVPAIDDLMKASTRALFPHFYDAHETEASAKYIAHVDKVLVDDGIYFVAEVDGDLIACGGWSRRYKLYTGSGAGEEDARLLDPESERAPVRAMFVRGDWTRRGLGTRILEACEEAARAEGFKGLTLMATLPGVPLYSRYGFKAIEDTKIPMPDGTVLDGLRMEKAIADA